jgi:hypothetical protein
VAPTFLGRCAGERERRCRGHGKEKKEERGPRHLLWHQGCPARPRGEEKMGGPVSHGMEERGARHTTGWGLAHGSGPSATEAGRCPVWHRAARSRGREREREESEL